MIKLSDLNVSQNGLRNVSQIGAMIWFVKKNGFFTMEEIHRAAPGPSYNSDTKLIQITRFEDGALYIQDGHHRITSIFLGGRDYLRDDEYEITDWKYEDYMTINFKMKWVTPYDPRKEIRMADYQYFKSRVFDRYVVSEEDAVKYILSIPWCYKTPRNISSIESFAEKIFSP